MIVWEGDVTGPHGIDHLVIHDAGELGLDLESDRPRIVHVDGDLGS